VITLFTSIIRYTVDPMSSTRLIPFQDLTNFQQWVIFYLKTNGKMLTVVEREINNFCDTTKNNIDLNNYDQNMTSLQNELMYFNKVGLIKSQGDYFVFTTKGDLYCYQNLERHLEKLSITSIVEKIKSSSLFKKNTRLCSNIINLRDLSRISPLLITNKKEAMENIKFFVQLLLMLLSS